VAGSGADPRAFAAEAQALGGYNRGSVHWIIRAGMPQDAPELSNLAARAKARWGYPPDWLHAWRDELTITPAYLSQNQVLVAQAGGEVIGTCALEDHGSSWALEHVWVEPAKHGAGVGRALVQRALAEARARRPGVVTVKSDPNAVGFYLRLGARQIGVAPAPMPSAPDRVLTLLEFGSVAT
jgi:predicted N-acetyltransferase YhbS